MTTKSENSKVVSFPSGRIKPHTQVRRCCQIIGDRNAGVLISWLLSWSRKASPKRGLEGDWNANPRSAILAATGLTWKQYRRAQQLLIDVEAAEFRTHSFAGKRMVFTRITKEFMYAFANPATSWLESEISEKGCDDQEPLTSAPRADSANACKQSGISAKGHHDGTMTARSGHYEGTIYTPSVLPSFSPDSDSTESPTLQNQNLPERDARKHARAKPSLSRSALPTDWHPSPTLQQLALDRGLDPDSVLKKFAAYARAKALTSADWYAQAELWILNERPSKPDNAWKRHSKDPAFHEMPPLPSPTSLHPTQHDLAQLDRIDALWQSHQHHQTISPDLARSIRSDVIYLNYIASYGFDHHTTQRASSLAQNLDILLLR
jgi:hypothetical protein